MLRSLRIPMLAALGAATLSACVSFGAKPPPFLLTLTADAAPGAGEARTANEAQALTILIPTAPQKLRTQRIPVQQDDASIAYVKDAQWVEAPQRLFQRLLSETVAARSSRVVLDEGTITVDRPVAGERFEDVVAAMSAALDEVSEKVADRVEGVAGK